MLIRVFQQQKLSLLQDKACEQIYELIDIL